MNKPTVYLAGPIVGCTKGEANDWRIYVAEKLAKHGIIGVSPLRCEPLIGERYTIGNMDPRFGTAKAIGSKNNYDVRQCDMTLAYIPKPEGGEITWLNAERSYGEWVPARHSWGTMCELSWAYILGKPAVLVSDDADVRNHPVINAQAGWVLEDLDDALDVLIGILGGYNGGKNV